MKGEREWKRMGTREGSAVLGEGMGLGIRKSEKIDG